MAMTLGVATPVAAQLQSEATNGLYVSYDIAQINSDNIGESDFKFDGGFTIGYTRSQPISPNVPLFIQAGFEVSYQRYARDLTSMMHLLNYDVVDPYINLTQRVEVYGYEEYKFEYTYLSIPIGFMFDLSLGGAASMQPFGGFNIKIGCSANESNEYIIDTASLEGLTYVGATELEFWDAFQYATGESRRNDWSYYDEQYMGQGEEWNRFLYGYQFGVNFVYSNILFMVKYQQDIAQITNNCKYQSVSIGLGVVF